MKKLKTKKENSICYVCQTLVEDDRLNRKQMNYFLNLLLESIGDNKLYIKLHFRSDMSLYEKFKARKIYFFRNEFLNVISI